MEKILAIGAAICFSAAGCTQPFAELQSLVDAEKRFAQKSVDEGIRSAFLAYFDDRTIAFKKGQPVEGRADWEAREESNTYLFWWPVYAEIASSGEFGYTTGPAQWGESRDEKKPVGGIYYASVWKKDAAGQWKVLADLGSATYQPGDGPTDWRTTTSLPARTNGEAGASLLEADQNYTEQLNVERKSFIPSYFSTEGRIHRPGRQPVTGRAKIDVNVERQKFAFERVGGEAAASADLGFTYGKVKVLMMRDDKETEVPACYLRVWKKEEGRWKIVLDVIGGA